VQWAPAYVAAAFALLQRIDIFAQRFAWPDSIERILLIVSRVGFSLRCCWLGTTASAVRSGPTLPPWMILAEYRR
jgi:hypothetical protein